jgi:hypothetical protein
MNLLPSQVAAIRRMLVVFEDHAWHYRLFRRYIAAELRSRAACRRGQQKSDRCCLKHVYGRLRREMAKSAVMRVTPAASAANVPGAAMEVTRAR